MPLATFNTKDFVDFADHEGLVLLSDRCTPPVARGAVRAMFVPWLGGVLTERLVGEPGAVISAEPGVTSRLPRAVQVRAR